MVPSNTQNNKPFVLPAYDDLQGQIQMMELLLSRPGGEIWRSNLQAYKVAYNDIMEAANNTLLGDLRINYFKPLQEYCGLSTDYESNPMKLLQAVDRTIKADRKRNVNPQDLEKITKLRNELSDDLERTLGVDALELNGIVPSVNKPGILPLEDDDLADLNELAEERLALRKQLASFVQYVADEDLGRQLMSAQGIRLLRKVAHEWRTDNVTIDEEFDKLIRYASIANFGRYRDKPAHNKGAPPAGAKLSPSATKPAAPAPMHDNLPPIAKAPATKLPLQATKPPAPPNAAKPNAKSVQDKAYTATIAPTQVTIPPVATAVPPQVTKPPAAPAAATKAGNVPTVRRAQAPGELTRSGSFSPSLVKTPSHQVWHGGRNATSEPPPAVAPRDSILEKVAKSLKALLARMRNALSQMVTRCAAACSAMPPEPTNAAQNRDKGPSATLNDIATSELKRPATVKANNAGRSS